MIIIARLQLLLLFEATYAWDRASNDARNQRMRKIQKGQLACASD
jgi:hypothetical protein